MPPVTTIQAAALQQLLRHLGGQVDALAPTDRLRPGEIVGGRVTLGPGGEKSLMLGGVRIAATLPADVPLDRALKFEVTESGPDKLVLRVVSDATTAAGAAAALPGDQAAAAGAAGPIPWAAVPMPGGAQARLWTEDDDEGEESSSGRRAEIRTMVVRYDSPVLGRLDIVLRLGDDQLDVTALAAAGMPLQAVRMATEPLRDALTVATGRPVQLSTARRTTEDVDVRV